MRLLVVFIGITLLLFNVVTWVHCLHEFYRTSNYDLNFNRFEIETETHGAKPIPPNETHVSEHSEWLHRQVSHTMNKKRDVKEQVIPVVNFLTDLNSKPYKLVRLYLSEKALEPLAKCENATTPCKNVGDAMRRLDFLVSNWVNSLNQSNSMDLNIFVRIYFEGNINDGCNNRILTSIHPNINYLLEIYSNSLKNGLFCPSLSPSLFEFRKDMKRLYFHDMKLYASLVSEEFNPSIGFYNCLLTCSINIGGFSMKNLTMGDIVFQRVSSSTGSTQRIVVSNVKTIQFINSLFDSVTPFNMFIVNCELVEFSQSGLGFIASRFYYVKSFKMSNTINSGGAIIITHANSVDISLSKFQYSKYYYPAVTVEFANNFKLLECQASNLDVFLDIGAVTKITLEKTQVTNCNVFRTFKSVRSIVDIVSVDTMEIIGCSFSSNYGINGGDISIEEIVSFIVRDSTFSNSFASNYGGAISIEGFSENGYLGESYIFNSTFISNRAEKLGGALFFGSTTNLLFKACLFKENYAGKSGGAIFIQQDQLIANFDNTTFIGNSVNWMDHLFDVSQGCGGAMTVFYPGSQLESYEGAEFVNNRALRGGALCILSFSMLGKARTLFQNLRIVNNSATISGGAIFVNNEKGYPENVIFGNGLEFKNNSAIKFGENLASLGLVMNLNTKYETKVASGKNITIGISLNGAFNMSLPLDSEMIKIYSQDLYLKTYFLPKSSQVNITCFLTTKIEEPRVFTITIQTESGIVQKFNVSITSCPEPLKMTPDFIDGHQIFTCKKIIDIQAIIISVAVPVGVITLIGGSLFGFLVFYCTSIIISKLKLLNKKQKAEKILERKILDTSLVFELEENEILSSSKNSGPKSSKKPHLGELELPLLDSFKVSSVIIPIEKIVITKRIGEGGYGNVYQGLWVNTEVAIKSLKTTDDDSEFEKEASILSQLAHPNIVSFYGVCITENTKYMVTEFVKKGSLDKLIYKCKNNVEFLSLKEKISILIGASNGMYYLHTLQPSIIHRDLKPGNILLDQFNNSKVCDFGLVRIISSGQSTMTLNVGTLFYMAPEIIQESTFKISCKSDVYSFGILMYELFFLENPYVNGTSKKIHHFRNSTSDNQPFTVPTRILNNERPVIPFTSNEELDEWMSVYGKENSTSLTLLKQVTLQFIELMKKCWDRDPNERPDFSQVSKRLIQMNEILQSLTRLCISCENGDRIDCEGIKYIVELKRLTNLNIPTCSICDEGAKYISEMKELISLDISNNKIGYEGVENIGQLKQLTKLNISYNTIGCEGAKYLTELSKKLIILNIAENRINQLGTKYISQLKQLTQLNICYNKIESEGAKLIGFELKQLTHLDISSNNIGIEGAKYLNGLENLKILDISCNSIYDEGAEYISELKQLTHLEISGNIIRNRGSKCISELKGLTNLDIRYNYIGNEGARYVSELKQLKILKCSSNDIGKEGAKYIGELKQLTELSISGNFLGCEGALDIGKLKQLTILDICTCDIGDEGVKYVGQLDKLTHLYISGSEIGDDGCKYLSRLKQLTNLDISTNNIREEGAMHLSQLKQLTSLEIQDNILYEEGALHISHLNQLTYLNIYNTNIGDEGAKYLSTLKQLIHLDTSNNLISDEGVKYISDLKHLTHLDISTNCFTSVGANSISELKLLTYLHVENNNIGNEGAKYLIGLKKLRNS